MKRFYSSAARSRARPVNLKKTALIALLASSGLFSAPWHDRDNCLAADIVEDRSEVNAGPISQYCKYISDILVIQCRSKSAPKDPINVQFCVDASGHVDRQIAKSFNGSEDDKNTALEFVKKIEIKAPPIDVKTPLCLNAELHRRAKNIYVTMEGIEFKPFMDGMQRQVKRHWFPPRSARTTFVAVRYQLLPDGSIRNVKLSHSSGEGEIDQAGLRAVREAAPFRTPPPPDGFCECVSIEFKLDYKVHDRRTDKLIF